MRKHRKGKPSNYRLRNWSKYNNALKNRGKIVFMITRNIEATWLALEPDKKLPGPPVVFTDKAIEISHRYVNYFICP